jgi:hypothetical protein
MIKLIGAIINERLNEAMEKLKIFTENMFSFRPRMGTQEATRTLVRTIESRGDKESHIMLLDIQGAIPRNVLKRSRESVLKRNTCFICALHAQDYFFV